MPYVALFNAHTDEELPDTRQWVMEGEERVLWSGDLLPQGVLVYMGVWEAAGSPTHIGGVQVTPDPGYDMEATLTWLGP